MYVKLKLRRWYDDVDDDYLNLTRAVVGAVDDEIPKLTGASPI